MKAYIEILRPSNAFMSVIAVVLMAFINQYYHMTVLVGAITVFLATGAGNAVNDYYDYRIDMINRPERPIPSGRIKRQNALYYSLILFITAIILGFGISCTVGLIVVICTILMILYAYNLKKQVLLGNLTVSLLTGLTFIFGGVIVNDVKTGVILAIFAFLMTLSREIIKDTEDMKGDLEENAETFPIKYGEETAINLAVVFNVLTCILSPFLYIFNIFKAGYLAVVLAADVIFIYSAYKAKKDYTEENLHKVSEAMKIAMCIAFVSFAAGSLI